MSSPGNLAAAPPRRYAIPTTCDRPAREIPCSKEQPMGSEKRVKRPTKRQVTTPRSERSRPESLRLRSLAASLTVNDLARSMAWYRDVLGFTVGERWEEDGKVRGI